MHKITITLASEGETPESLSATVKGETLELEPPEGDSMPFNLVFKKKQN